MRSSGKGLTAPRRAGWSAVILLALLSPGPALSQAVPDPGTVERAFASFWAAPGPEAAAARIPAVVASGVSFAEALARLRRGRPHPDAVEVGRRDLNHRIPSRPGSADSVAHPYTVIVPNDYDPARAYPVRVQLHGGVGRPLEGEGRAGDQADRLPGTGDEIQVLPNAWPRSMWWEPSQVDNLSAILDRLKRTYNVDENRVYLTGISDGGTGVYFFALRAPTPFASFLPLNGQMLVLANRNARADGDIFPGNAVNRPFFVVNGGRDPLYPAARVRPFVEHLGELGGEVIFHARPEAGHDTRWWLQERDAFEGFVAAHPRDPLPDRLSWQTERVDRYNRVDWLTIDRLGRVPGEARLMDTNLAVVDGRRVQIFPHAAPSGRVDLQRRGNTVEASTEGVRTFTLLLSPDRFDFDRPVTVIVNGGIAFEGLVAPSVETLLAWAARDNDRTMLFGAALQIDVAR